MSNTRNVLIFGPTGAVGSTAALTAHQQGAKIALAMRDPSKPTPALDSINVERVQADLTQPDSVKAAASQTGAKVAFIYAAWGTQDHMRATIEALKAGGIDTVVFLSSVTVKGEIRAVPASDVIGYTHAQIEVSLDEVFGRDNFVAVRPAFFASNSLMFKDDILNGELKHANPEVEFDWISPEDIGRVAGHVLAKGSRDNVITLLGPEKMSVRDALAVIGRALGKEVKTTKISGTEAFETMVAHGVPAPMANWFVVNVLEHPGEDLKFGASIGAFGNIQKYTNQAPVRFQQWVEENKQKFEA